MTMIYVGDLKALRKCHISPFMHKKADAQGGARGGAEQGRRFRGVRNFEVTSDRPQPTARAERLSAATQVARRSNVE